MAHVKRRKKDVMPPVRIGPKHQVTIPRDVFTHLHLSAGDFLEATADGGRIVLTPLRLAAKAPAAKLAPAEQKLLLRARAKIDFMRKNLVRSRGLTRQEAAVAAKVGLIESEQQYWWTEEWQKGERSAEADRRARRILGSFESVAAMKEALKRRARASA
jgi:bifunctional DNA-binding transcriptional regulator/antitoxin component of YhaV-PrlF toxin-antitoxin module